jgi:hypothetical protein
MKVLTPIFGFFGKAGSRVNTPEEGDTKLTMPGVLNPTLDLVYPTFQLFNVPLPGGSAGIPIYSWIYSEEFSFAGAASPVIAVVGPGLWEFLCSIILEEVGAVSDPTSSARLDMFDQVTGQTVTLLRVRNKQGLDQSEQMRFKLLATGDQTYTFTRISVAGLGTGANLAKITIIATRLF